MGLFNKDNNTEETKTPRNPNNLIMIRLLAVGYVTYLCINMVKLYIEGGPDAPALTTLILGLAVLGGGAIALGIVSYKEWKRNKVEYDQYMAQLREEAEAKRAAEEAQAAADDEEGAYYDALEEAEEETEE